MARAVSSSLPKTDMRERFVAAGLRALQEYGAAELTVRRVAELAGSSTMGVYTRFGGRTGMLEAIYHRGFELLRAALVAAEQEATLSGEQDVGQRIVRLATAYRHFALENPALYALMFERPLPDFDPSPALRSEALNSTFILLIDEIRRAQGRGLVAGDDPLRPSYLVWAAIHGIVSIELTHAVRSPLPGWFRDSAEVGHQVLVDAVSALLLGLR
jgi:AcrR family transcriptional regulator